MGHDQLEIPSLRLYCWLCSIEVQYLVQSWDLSESSPEL